MFQFNEDVRLYWFDGGKDDSTLCELAGIMLGRAIYNGHFFDMPLVPVIYKLLLGIEPDLNDMY